MKEREKLVTAILVLTLSIIFTIFVSYTNNLFGIKDYISDQSVDTDGAISTKNTVEEIEPDVFEVADMVKTLYFEEKYAEIYQMGNRDMIEKGSCETFEKACRKSKKPAYNESEYTICDAGQSIDKSEYRIKYEASGDELVIYIREEKGELKVSGIQKTERKEKG